MKDQKTAPAEAERPADEGTTIRLMATQSLDEAEQIAAGATAKAKPIVFADSEVVFELDELSC